MLSTQAFDNAYSNSWIHAVLLLWEFNFAIINPPIKNTIGTTMTAVNPYVESSVLMFSAAQQHAFSPLSVN